jgi:hypothetical protein
LVTPAAQLWLTILGCAAGGIILAGVWETIRAGKFPGTLLVFTALQLGILVILPFMADRYLEVFFPGAILLAAGGCTFTGARRFPAIAATAASGLIAIGLFHDWAAWNSARWALGREAVTRNIRPMDIEGGLEWDGWHSREETFTPPAASASSNSDANSLTLPFTKSFFPMVSGRYALAFTQPTNSVIIASMPYSTWLPPGKKSFLLVQQKP